MIDLSTSFGARVSRRLADEQIIWLTTVDPQQAPQPAPVWFWWDGGRFLIYSQPRTAKLRNIRHNPQVALHFDGDGAGGDIVVFTATAQIDPAAPPADQVADYVAKYSAGFTRIGMTAASFAQSYSVALWMTPEQLRGH